MEDLIVPNWLIWAREIEAISQTGLHYAENEYDRQRYQRLMQLSAEIIAKHSEIAAEPMLKVFIAQLGYATPKVDVRAAVFANQRLLMVQERSDGGWTLPGGWADVGDLPSKSAERETWEEAGFHVKANRVIGIYDANRSGPLELFHAYKVVYLCELIGGEATPSYETSNVKFFAKDELPSKLSGERTKPRHLIDAFSAFENPNQPTVFD